MKFAYAERVYLLKNLDDAAYVKSLVRFLTIFILFIDYEGSRLFDQLCAVVHHNCAHHMHTYIMSSSYTVD